MPIDYTDLASVKAELEITSTDTARDAYLSTLITAVSRFVDVYTGRTGFETANGIVETASGVVDLNGNLRIRLNRPPVTAVTSIEYRSGPPLSWTLIDSGYYLTAPDGTAAQAYTGLTPGQPVQVRVTYSGGYGAATANLPADLKYATTVLVARAFKRRLAQHGDNIVDPATGVTTTIRKAMSETEAMILDHYKIRHLVFA